MKTIRLAVLPFTFLATAILLGGCMGAEPIEGEKEHEEQAEPGLAQPEAADAEPVATADQALITNWRCDVYAGHVTIWWGYTSTDAKWACDNWIPACRNTSGGCDTNGFTGNPDWNCYLYKGPVSIDWGHTTKDAKWACDNWIPACSSVTGGCNAF